MHRLLVALLAALDAVIAAAGGVALVLAPLALLWVVGLGGAADWGALWPATGVIWQLGHLVPLAISLPVEYLGPAGIDPAGASFAISLAPLALAVFTAGFAARSGRRAAQAGAPATGVGAGTLVFLAAAAALAITAATPIVQTELWRAIVVPTLVFAVPAATAAFIESWRIEERGPIARLRTRTERAAWGALPALLTRGTAAAIAGLVAVGAAVTGVTVLVRAGEIVALYQATQVDLLGSVVLTLAQLAYLPTLIVWGLSFAAGPGFALGSGTAVSPAGTQVGVLPGIPVLGAVPESSTPWLLLLVLLPISIGVATGWMLRSRLAAQTRAGSDDGGLALRLVLALGVAALTAAAAALLAVVARGAIGPGRLSELGPHPGALALAIGAEMLVGTAILLLLPRRGEGASRGGSAAASAPSTETASADTAPIAQDEGAPPAADDDPTEPIPGFGRGSR